MIRWLLRVLPPWWIVALFAVIYSAIATAENAAGHPRFHAQLDRLTPRAILLFFACACYGLFRVFRFHPLLDRSYCEWLKTVPWTCDRPLAKGPVYLVLQDAIIVGVLAVLAFQTRDATPILCIAIFLGVYLATAAVFIACTGVFTEAYLIAFGLGLSVRLHEYQFASMAVLLGLCILSRMGLRRSLALFPWESPRMDKLMEFVELAVISGRSRRGQTNRLGYPYDLLKQYAPEPIIPVRHALLMSLLAAWCVYVILWRVEPLAGREFTRVFCIFFPICAGITRLVMYCVPTLPPISLLGRVATGRWIIPEYDYVLLAPLATTGIGMTIGLGLMKHQVPFEVAGSVVVFVVSSIVLGAGPTFGIWRLLGRYRVALPFTDNNLTRI